MKVYAHNAFAITPEGGNPAGICLYTEGLTDKEMQTIAAKVGFSETAFVFPSDKADFKVRFFTPVNEVDLCGHATIATFSLLHKLGKIAPGHYSQETPAGILAIEVDQEGLVIMDQNPPVFGPVVDKERTARSLGISPDLIAPELPVRAVSTGLMDLIVPLTGLEAMEALKPDFSMIQEISRDLLVSGYHLFTTESLTGATAHCRNFAPLCGIDEEAATGTATGATASYMRHYGLLDKTDLSRLKFEQGYSMGRPSEIRASIEAAGKEIKRVRVGGRAMGLENLEL